MIPLTVHYLNLSGKPQRFALDRLGELRRMLPDHGFVEWDSDALEREELPPAVEKLLYSKDASRVSSYVSAYLLYRYGGVYMDPATVLFRDLKDLSPVGLYCFREYRPEHLSGDGSLLNAYGNALTEGTIPGSGISSAMMASEKGHPLLKRYMQFFEDNLRSVLDERGLTASDLWAMALRGWGLRYLDELQVLYYGVLVYPSEYLPSDPGKLSPLSLGLSLGGDPWEKKGKFAESIRRRKALKAAAEHMNKIEAQEVPAAVMPPPGADEDIAEEDSPEKFFSRMDDAAGTTEDTSPPGEEEENNNQQ